MPADSAISLRHVLAHRCPACHKGKLYQGVIKPVTQCDVCHTDFSNEDAGDGPAFFAITIAGFIITFLAAFAEQRFSLSYLMHAFIWVPATFVLCIWLIRIVKSYLIHLQYHTGGFDQRKQ